jgi:hypothetical protein
MISPPPLLSAGMRSAEDENGGAATGKGPVRLKLVTLPKGWRIPRGKIFGDFFN